MSRPKIIHDMPPIRELWPRPESLRKMKAPLTQALAQELRKMIPGLQTGQSRAFYTTREIAAHFRVDLKAVGQACKLLQGEGLLVRVRGSATLVSPVQSLPRQKIRGVVAVPVWSYGFCNLFDWRLFHMGLEESLRGYDYVANLIFFGEGDEAPEKMIKRILMHRPDMIVWYQPLMSVLDILQRLSDVGIRPVVIPDKGVHFPFSSYQVDKVLAAQKAMRAWKRAGISRINFISTGKISMDDEIFQQMTMTGKLSIPVRCIETMAVGLAENLKTMIPSADEAFVIYDINLCAMLFRHNEEDFRSLIKSNRVLLPGHIDSSSNQLHGVKADFILTDLSFMAAQIAKDIASQNLPALGSPRVFHAEYLARAETAQFARTY